MLSGRKLSSFLGLKKRVDGLKKLPASLQNLIRVLRVVEEDEAGERSEAEVLKEEGGEAVLAVIEAEENLRQSQIKRAQLENEAV